jgi:hypothetical protein
MTVDGAIAVSRQAYVYGRADPVNQLDRDGLLASDGNQESGGIAEDPECPTCGRPVSACTCALPEWLPEEAYEKIPDEWGIGRTSANGRGWRWQRPGSQGGDSVRISREPNGDLTVQVRSNGRVLDGNGNPIEAPRPSKTSDAHIPYRVWRPWRTWHAK